ncbi:MAG: hypothetical protein IT301_06270 [Dehalococcoidia bacterium]|nr:hypothetical protein [Dehalococcoidia bacterium]
MRKLDGDELDVVGLVIDRLSLGRGIYGQWVAGADLRDLEREALDEELDDVVYRAMRTLIQRRSRSVSQEEADHIRARLDELYRGPREAEKVLEPADLCSHLGHAGGRDHHFEPVRKPHWFRRWWWLW